MAMMHSGRTTTAPLLVLAMLLALAALATGCGSSESAESPGPSPGGATISEQQVMDLVDTTCAAVEKAAPGAFAAIDAGEAPYVDPADPALYAFVYDTDVTLLATPDDTTRGQNMKGKPDAAGTLFRDQIVSGALANGSGWVSYVYEEPGEEGLFEKETHFKLVTGSDGAEYVVCAGRYLGPAPEDAQASPSTAAGTTREQVEAFVREAIDYAQANGKKSALAAFTAPGGEFHQAELYIYADDFTGTVIAHGGDPSLVGKNLIGMEDPNGVHVIKDLVRLAEGGSGWLSYTWPNPEHGNREEPKLGFVTKVDETWFLGSGMYLPAE
jgi:polar amino acid transport system substrate-binding protein